MSEMCDLFGWVLPSKDHPCRPFCWNRFVFFASVNTWGCFICPIGCHHDDTNIFSSTKAPTSSRYAAENQRLEPWQSPFWKGKSSEPILRKFGVSAINWLQHFSIEILIKRVIGVYIIACSSPLRPAPPQKPKFQRIMLSRFRAGFKQVSSRIWAEILGGCISCIFTAQQIPLSKI